MIHLRGPSYAVALSVCLLGILGQWLGSPWQRLWSAPAAVWILALTAEGLAARRRLLHFTRETPARALLGRATECALTLRNPGPGRLVLRAVQPLAEDWAGAALTFQWSLAASSAERRAFCITPVNLGRRDWPRLYCRVRGRLGLAWWERYWVAADRLQVVPDSLHGRERLAPRSAYTGSTVPRGGSGMELLYLRDYRPGDPLRTIDWKATARCGKTTVRVMAGERQTELMLLIDCGRRSAARSGALNRLGHAVNAAARLAERAVTNGDSVGFVVYADTVLQHAAPAPGTAAIRALRTALAGLKPLERESSLLPAVLRTLQVLPRRGLIVILGHTAGEESASDLPAAVRLLAAKHLTLYAALLDDELEALRHAEARHWLDPFQVLAAYELREAGRAAALRLVHQGAEVVQQRPSRLDRALLGRYAELRAARRA
ncbi:MAG: DUF58 domain-containing protein [Gammaproteobacteria bacterium]